MNRREFIAVPLAAGVAAAATTGQGPIGVAFLGVSHSHAKGKLKVIQGSAAYKLLGVWDEDEAVRKQIANMRIVPPEEMLRDPAVEAVIVESDVPDHERHAKMALEAGKHVHVEKPPSADVPAFRELLDLAARKKRLFQQGYMWRHHPGFLKLHEIVKSGALGDVYLVTGVMHKTLDAERRPEWARFRGGQMFELCSHLIDQVVRLQGRPDRITPFLKKHGHFNDNLADNTVAVLEFPGSMGIIIGSALNPDGNRYRSFVVSGTKGTITLEPIEPGDLFLDLKAAAGPYPKGKHQIRTGPYVRFEDDFKEFAAAIRDGKPLSVSAMEDLMVQEAVIEASGMQA
jgi:predicted dehydrogenase